MSDQLIDLKYFEAINWLKDIGCDEPVTNSQRSFHGLISRDNPSPSILNNSLNNKSHLDIISSIQELKKYLYSKYSISNTNFSFYDGSEKADLMVIGDKSEDTNIKKSKPFQGKEGKLLDAMLKAIEYDRNTTYYTNLYFPVVKLDVNLALDIVKKQIAIVQPKIIIMFGSEVTKLLSRTEEGIFQTRGKWYDINISNGSEPISGISMFHPRYVLVHPESKKESWLDLKAVRKKLA
jgi:uracil-DNA glycosylase